MQREIVGVTAFASFDVLGTKTYAENLRITAAGPEPRPL